MGLSRSLTTGASSLKANQYRFDIISNNIANVNTVGYKTSRANFAEQFNQVYNRGKSPDSTGGNGFGGIDPLQFGLGVKIGSITQNMAQGAIETTNRPLDMAIQGEGFFVYNLNGRQLYSRAGVISRDRDGYLVDSSTGAYMQGYNLLTESGKIKKDSAGVNLLDRTISSLKISTNTMSQPKQTENIKISGNLNSTNETDAERQTSITIFDSAGTPHTVTFTFTKTDVNKYSVEVSAMINGTKTVIGSGTNIEFNPDGTIKAPDPAEFTLAAGDLNTAFGTVFDAAKDIKVTLAPTDNKLAGLTEFSGPNTATANEQDGFQTGELIDLAVDPTGKIWGSFTNGQSEVLGQVVTAKFTNPTALIREGNNLLASSPDSGLPNIGTAGEIFPSTKIVGGALEQSNVDMTEQFTEMIIAQRAFEAASRTITVSDQMLAETNMIKR